MAKGGKKGSPELDEEQLDKAITALLKWLGKRKDEGADLLQDEDDVIYLQISLKAVPTGPRKDKPHLLPLAHPIYEKGKAQVCLFVKDHKGEGHEEAKRRHAQMANTGIHKVIGISQLRKKYESFESKRNLCNSYDIFLADERIVPSLPRLIGKKFFKSKKQPVPVNVAGSNWGAKVDKALAGTFMVNPQGSCFSFKVAVSNQTRAQIAENVTVALKAACDLVPKKFDNVSAVYLKTAESAALPVYQALPQPLQKI